MRVKDQLNREINLQGPPKRIVSLVPSQTELLVRLGLEEQLVGVTKFCVHPETLRSSKTVVGGTKSVRLDKIKSLSPDIILCNKEENTPQMVAALEPVAPVWISDVETYGQALEMIQAIGMLCGRLEKARALADAIEVEKNRFLSSIKTRPVRKVAYLIWKEPYMAVGKSNFIDDMLRLNNLQNVFGKGDERYPEIAMEDLKAADLILLSTEPFPFKKKDAVRMEMELEREVQLVDGEFFSWYGSRMLGAFNYFKGLHV